MTGRANLPRRSARPARGWTMRSSSPARPGDCTHIAQAARFLRRAGPAVCLRRRRYAQRGRQRRGGPCQRRRDAFSRRLRQRFHQDLLRSAAFRSLPRLLDAEEATFDLIRCNGQNYAVNICSMASMPASERKSGAISACRLSAGRRLSALHGREFYPRHPRALCRRRGRAAF